MVLSAINVIIK